MMRFYDPKDDHQEARVDVELLIYYLKQIPNNHFFDMLAESYTRTSGKFYLPVHTATLVDFQQLKGDFEDGLVSFEHHNQESLEEILVTTPRLIVSMNVIQLKKWRFETDIIEHFAKLNLVKKHLEKHGNSKTIIQVLFVSEKIWDLYKKQPDEMKDYKKLRNYLRHEREKDVPFIVLFLEDVLKLVEKLD
ncbi:MAG: hypothetical protein ACK4M9_02985 [Anaerobacillus sp.]|uniref:hypothetical protein n=1 Tax=Anaerobacillus sp. TaxID=1872506 RepID=UPI00391B6650